MSFTKATLTTAIQDYTDNSESTFVSNIPNFIKAAEEKILKSVDLDYFRKNVTSALTSSDAFLTVPSDYLASFSLQITTSGSESFLLQKDVNFLREYTPPFALLYGSLVEAYTFMKGEPDVIQNYNGLFTQYLERVKDLGEARENTDGYRVGLPSRPRT